jgi:hypothetical protein
MLFARDEAGALATGVPGWVPEAVFWVLIALLVVGAALTILGWFMFVRVREIRGEVARLEALGEMQRQVERLNADRDDLDLRRIEHVLIDVRDGQARVEDALLRAIEAIRTPATTHGDGALVPVGAGAGLGERVVNRLLALGYERVQIVTRSEKLHELGAKDGEVLVEARREGVLHKGRVVVRSGRIAEVEVHPAYSIFP